MEIRRALGLLFEPGAVVELRILDTRRGTVSGYFDDPERLAQAAAEWSGQALGVYVTLNALHPALLARSANRLTHGAKHATADADVVRRAWFPIDLDPVRPAGVSATDGEQAAALARARAVRAWLKSEGWPPSLLAHSGNGAHLLARVDLPNDPASTALVRRALEALAFRFSDAAVSVDRSPFNAARIWRCYGTPAAKGDPTPDRPHRRARLLEVPDPVRGIPREALERLAALAPPADSGDGRGTAARFDLDAWLAAHGEHLAVAATGPWNGGRRWVLNPCPWNRAHTNRAAYIVQHASGAVAAGCHHDGCAGRGWADLRALVEPGWRGRPVASVGRAPAEDGSAAPTGTARGRQAGLAFTPLAELLREPPEVVRWCVEGRLPAGGLSLLAGKPKAGKSTLARCLALAVARGAPWIGWATTAGPVFYLALEEKRAEVRAHFEAMGARDEDVRVLVAQAPEDGLLLLREAAERVRPTLIIVDPLFRFVRVRDANDYAELTRALEPLLALGRETGAHVLVVHHLGKGERAGGDAILGSTAIFGAVVPRSSSGGPNAIARSPRSSATGRTWTRSP